MDADTRARASRIRLLALDVDGVLTDGGVYVFEDGRECRRFNIKDGLGLRMVLEAGIKVALISSATTKPVEYRARILGIDELHVGVQDKLQTLRDVCVRLEVNLSEVAYMGDDLPDVRVLNEVGLPCAPRDAIPRVRNTAAVVTLADGGQGAVRELCDLLLLAVPIPSEEYVLL